MTEKSSSGDWRKRGRRRDRPSGQQKTDGQTGRRGTPASKPVRSMHLWEGARGTAGLSLDGGAFRPVDWVIWVEQPMGLVVGNALVPADDDLAMASTLAHALVAPMFGAPRQPRAVRVATQAMTFGLDAALGGGVPVEVAPTPRTEALGRSLAARLEREESCGDLDLNPVGADVLADLFDAMSGLAAEEALLAESAAVRIDAPGMGVDGAIGCMVDFDGDGSGLLILPSVEHYRALSRATAKRPPRDASSIVVMLVQWEMLPKRARRDVEKHGWRRAADGRCPLLIKRGPGGEEISATAQDHLIATVFARTMTDLARNNSDDMRSNDRAIQCTLRIPRVGDIDVLCPGDLDEDELASIVAEKAEATIFLPQAVYQAALDVDVLSPRARCVLEQASPSDAEPGFDLRATLPDLDHVGRLLMTVSMQASRPAVLEEAAMRILGASQPPVSLSSARRPPNPTPRSRAATKPRAAAPSGARRRASKKGRALYELKITLQDIRPPIWRRIEVRSDISLAGLHLAIQGAMGWENDHLHAFECGGRRFGPRDPDFDAFEGDLVNEKTAQLNELLTERGSSLLYHYDFGDGWVHDVVLKEIKPMLPGGRAPKPRCLGGERACPPEDCGGPFGYAEMLKALKHPRHPEHAHYREWIGGDFDPEAF